MPHSSQDSPPGNKIRSAIDLLLSSDSVEVSDPNINITECDPLVDVVMNKQGGICTKCNTLFESKVFLLNHLKTCNSHKINDKINIKNEIKNNNRAKLVIVGN